MNKIYQRIDWENYPSSATPLNEDNLNKMDYAIDKLDDRIVTHETTKLNTATGNTLVKNVTFNEKTGVFTIEKLSGSKITINTALEKISTNFHFNPTTQKLVLTLIDGTVQEIDLSALITQYEFIESDTITFEIDASGKVKANILNGSITGEKLEPNYLADVTLQAKNAKTSADNAKTSEELAYQYAEEAKESASQTAKSDAKNITYDNTESGLSATNVKDALDEVAQGSASAIATETTITDSTNAPLVSLKVKGKTEQFTTSGKNLCNSNDFTITAPNIETAQSNYAYKSIDIHDKIVSNKTYIFSADIKILAGSPSEISVAFFKEDLLTGTEIKTGTISNNHVEISISIGNASVYYYLLVYAGKQGSTAGNSIEFSNVMLRESTTDSTYEPYTGGVASPNPDYPQEINRLAKDGTIEVKTCGKNIFGGLVLANKIVESISGATKNEITGTLQFSAVNADKKILFDDFKENTQYTLVFYGKNLGSYKTLNIKIMYTDGTITLLSFPETDYSYLVVTSKTEKTIKCISGVYQDSETILYYEKCGVFEGVITADDFEPYTETTASIPVTAPLYEGDYLEVYADGSGKLVRENYRLSENFTVSSFYKEAAGIALPYYGRNASEQNYSNYFLNGTGFENGKMALGEHEIGAYSHAYIKIEGLTTVEEYRTWINNHPDLEIVYKLTTPTETPLTAEQVAEFKKLYTFEPITNVLCEGETEIQYYKNTPGGVAMATVHKKSIAMETVDIISGICEWRTGTNITANLNDITYGRGMFVAVGSSGATYFSYDGAVWQTVSNSITETLRAVTYGAGKFVAVGYDGATYYSSSGIVWEAGSGATANFYDVAYGNGVWVAVGYEPGSSGGVVYYSTDGIKWNVGSSFSSSLSHITYGGGKFVIFPGSSTYYSSDGITWTESSVPVSISNAVYSNGKFLAVGVNSCIYYSTDGMNWSVGTSSSPTESTLRCMTYGDGVFVGIDIDDNIYYSYDGLTWHLILNAVGTLYAVTYGANSDGVNRFVSVGYGNVYYSNIIKESKKITDVINELYSLLK